MLFEAEIEVVKASDETNEQISTLTAYRSAPSYAVPWMHTPEASAVVHAFPIT